MVSAENNYFTRNMCTFERRKQCKVYIKHIRHCSEFVIFPFLFYQSFLFFYHEICANLVYIFYIFTLRVIAIRRILAADQAIQQLQIRTGTAYVQISAAFNNPLFTTLSNPLSANHGRPLQCLQKFHTGKQEFSHREKGKTLLTVSIEID